MFYIETITLINYKLSLYKIYVTSNKCGITSIIIYITCS